MMIKYGIQRTPQHPPAPRRAKRRQKDQYPLKPPPWTRNYPSSQPPAHPQTHPPEKPRKELPDHRFSVFRSLFSIVFHRSIRKPCGLLSDRVTGRSQPSVIRSRVSTTDGLVMRSVAKQRK
jgi:hypothetical protein